MKKYKQTLEKAISKNDVTLVEMILKSKTNKSMSKSFVTGLFEFNPNARIGKLLIKYGANINAKLDLNGNQCTPLGWATAKNNLGLVTLLIRNGAEVNGIIFKGMTPLHFSSDAEVTCELIQNGAEVLTVDNNGRSPLLSAIIDGRSFGVIKALMDAGSDLSITFGTQLNTLLHLADTWQITRELLHRGADPNTTNLKGETPLQLAHRFKKGSEICKELVEHGAMIDIPDCVERIANKTCGNRNSACHYLRRIILLKLLFIKIELEGKYTEVVLTHGPLLESLVLEINKLDKFKKKKSFTLIDIIKKEIDLSQSYEAIKMQIEYDFPIFKDVILECVEEYLHNLQLGKRIEKLANTKIPLNSYCLIEILQYLSNKDKYNMLAAME